MKIIERWYLIFSGLWIVLMTLSALFLVPINDGINGSLRDVFSNADTFAAEWLLFTWPIQFYLLILGLIAFFRWTYTMLQTYGVSTSSD